MPNNNPTALLYIPKAHFTEGKYPEYSYYCRMCPSEYRDVLFLNGAHIEDHPYGVREMQIFGGTHQTLDTQAKLDKLLRNSGFLLLKDLPNVQVDWKGLSALDSREVQHILGYCGITEFRVYGGSNKQRINAVILHPNELRRLDGLKGSIPDWQQSKAWPDNV